VAVKQLSETSNQGKTQFATEIETISRVQHRNLVKLYGCCLEGNKPLLVYEYLENGSLDKALFGTSSFQFNATVSLGVHICYIKTYTFICRKWETEPRLVNTLRDMLRHCKRSGLSP
jgi:serine/threonine protein kinase